MSAGDEIDVQRKYYASTADRYDELHLGNDPEHDVALAFVTGMLNHMDVRSMLDVGAGTGRTVMHINKNHPKVSVIGMEPVEELRKIGYEKGIPADQLLAGDATNMPFADQSFDIVCAFAVLHHIRRPNVVVAEMLRVARRAIVISDSNNYGQGSAFARGLKGALRKIGAWRLVDYLKTRGRGYMISEEDGISYSYSVFDSLPLIKKSCKTTHLLGTRDSGPNLLHSTGHVAVFGIK